MDVSEGGETPLAKTRSDSQGLTNTPMLKHTLILIALAAASFPALAQHSSDCSLAGPTVHAVAETHSLLAALSERMDRQQAEFGAGIRHAAARAKWSEEDRARFFQGLLRSKPNSDYEKQIASLTNELQGMLQAAKQGKITGPAAECRYVARLRKLVGQLDSVFARQSAYLNEQLRNVKSERRPAM